MAIKRILRLTFILTLFFSLAGGFGSCKSMHLDHASRMKRKEIRQSYRIQNKTNKQITKQYKKKYKQQIKTRNEQHRNMIKQAPKKPKNRSKSKSRFFLFRWLGI